MTKINGVDEISEFLEKVKKAKAASKVDLSTGEDLSVAIMNLVGLEEHFFFTAEKTGRDKYFDLLSRVREIRTDLLKKIVKEPEGEVWCISKHLLAASMRLIEVGTKLFKEGKKDEAKDLFDKAYELYNLFWGLNLKIIDLGEVKKIEDDKLNTLDKAGTNFFGKLSGLVKKIVDCCIE
ncbi:MAG: hypothetical protein Q8N98_02265 [bacterium]|nr:hypothetical protein [bacterium]